MDRLLVNVHEDRDNGLHGITSRDCGRLAGVDVFLPSMLGELADTVPMVETILSQKLLTVSSAVAEAGENTELTSGITSTAGTVADLSNSVVDSVERKRPEQVSAVAVQQVFTVAVQAETNTELGSCI